MRITIACLAVISMCLRCKIIDDTMKRRDETTKIVKRRDEVSKIMKNHYHSEDYGFGSFNYGFEIEGPFNIEQFKEHHIKRELERLGISEEKPGKHKELLDRIKRFPDSQKSKDFVRHMGSQEGNELYFFTSDLRSWSDLNGIEGYVIIQKNRIVDILVTWIN